MSKYTCIVNVTNTYTLQVEAESGDDAARIACVQVREVGEPDEQDIHVSCVMDDDAGRAQGSVNAKGSGGRYHD
jgi:hypothetical protein